MSFHVKFYFISFFLQVTWRSSTTELGGTPGTSGPRSLHPVKPELWGRSHLPHPAGWEEEEDTGALLRLRASKSWERAGGVHHILTLKVRGLYVTFIVLMLSTCFNAVLLSRRVVVHLCWQPEVRGEEGEPAGGGFEAECGLVWTVQQNASMERAAAAETSPRGQKWTARSDASYWTWTWTYHQNNVLWSGSGLSPG